MGHTMQVKLLGVRGTLPVHGPEFARFGGATSCVLVRAGVPCAICTDHNVIPEQFLPLCAGVAVGYGLPWEEAVKSITIRAAEIAGIEDRVGSLTPGKDADLVLVDGDPLSPYVHPEKVFVAGVEAPARPLPGITE